MKPIEAKLKYQIDKLLKFADGSIESCSSLLNFRMERLLNFAVFFIDFENDPIHLKPKLDNFADNSYEDSDEDEDIDQNKNDQDNKANKIYRPPKMAAVYNGCSKLGSFEKPKNKFKSFPLNFQILMTLQKISSINE
jgi:hypothetical protein